MKTSTKVGLGYGVAGLVAGFVIAFYDLDHLKVHIYRALAGACLVTVYWIAASEKR